MTFTFQYVSIIYSFTSPLATSFSIYIPICFYYFLRISDPFKILISFTFQYVSIILKCSTDDFTNKHEFTFQYVSIILSRNDASALSWSDLHSNMFLLFPSNVALYNSTTILPSFVDPVIIFCFFKKIFSFFPKLCIFPTKRQLSTPRLFYLITGRQFSFYMNSPSVSNSSCIISPMPFPVSNSNSYLYVALWISITFRFLPLPIIFLSTFSGNF